MRLPFRQIHLDFHTSEHIGEVGGAFDADAFAETMRQARVDSVTLFSRCHHGWIYHETRFKEARHPGLARDLLAEQIDALHKRGIRAPIYISVGFDERVARLHPEYIEVSAEGAWQGAGPLQAGWRKLCLNSPYVDYVFEQTVEVLERFDVDGLFFDIVLQRGCCCPRCLEGMRAEGLDPADPAQRKRWDRIVVERYRRRQTELVRRYNAECSIFFNAGHIGPAVRPSLDAYTHLELESLPTGGWGYDHFPVTARYARNLGLPFVGMTGKFQRSWGDFGGFKPQAALEYDCFAALTLGGRCSVGDQLHPSGALDPAAYELIGAVYASIERKEPWCDGARPVKEIAVFTPEALGLEDGRVDSSLRGAARLLQEAHLQFDIVDGEMPWEPYRLLVLPDKITLNRELAEKITRYVGAGGALLASHRSGLATAEEGEVFLPALGVRHAGPLPFSPDYLQPREAIAEGVPRTPHVMYERGTAVRPAEGGEILADIWEPYFERSYERFVSHAQTPPARRGSLPGAVRNRRCIYFAHPVFAVYGRYGSQPLARMLRNAIRLLLPDPAVESDAPAGALVSVMRQQERRRTVVHVVHYAPAFPYGRTSLIIDRLPLHNVGLSVRLTDRPSRAYLAPERAPLEFEWSEGRARVRIPRVDGHAMAVFES